MNGCNPSPHRMRLCPQCLHLCLVWMLWRRGPPHCSLSSVLLHDTPPRTHGGCTYLIATKVFLSCCAMSRCDCCESIWIWMTFWLAFPWRYKPKKEETTLLLPLMIPLLLSSLHLLSDTVFGHRAWAWFWHCLLPPAFVWAAATSPQLFCICPPLFFFATHCLY